MLGMYQLYYVDESTTPITLISFFPQDYRIPHANSRHNFASHPRVVVYIGLLPAVPINARYAEQQLDKFRRGEVPSDQWHESSAAQPCTYVFSELGEKLMGIAPWK